MIATVLLAGCSKQTAPPPPSRPSKAAVSFSTFATVTAGQRSRLILSGSGVLCLQADAGASALAVVTGPPLDMRKPVDRMTSALGSRTAPVVRAALRGNDDGLILYTAGTDGPRSLAGLWVYRLGNEAPLQIADATTLAQSSRLGPTIDLADAQLVRTSAGVMLCLVQSDAAAFLRLPDGPLKPGAALRLAFSAVRVDGEPLRLTTHDTFYTGPEGGLRLMRADGTLLAIDDTGNAKPLPTEPGRPAMSVPPLSLRSPGGQVGQLAFYPEPGQTRDVLTTPNLAAAPARYPALVLSDGQRTTVFDRDAIDVRPGFPVHALRITAWCQDPASGDVIAYDSFSGEIMRVKIGNDE